MVIPKPKRLTSMHWYRFVSWWQSSGGTISSEAYRAIDRLVSRLASEDASFLAAIHRDDESASLIYADWLEEMGDAYCARICRALNGRVQPTKVLLMLVKDRQDFRKVDATTA